MKNQKTKIKNIFLNTKYLILAASLLVLLLLPQAKALAATYYLDVNGNDSNLGTSEQPWKTIQRAQPDWTGGGNKVISGDTVLIKNGTYAGFSIKGSYTATDWITYKAAEGQTPTILGKSSIGAYPPVSKDYFIRFDGLKFLATAPLGYGNLVSAYYANKIEFLNCHIVGAGYALKDKSYGLSFIDCNTVKIDHCTFYGVSDSYEAPYKGNDHAINTRYSHNFIITNNDFTNHGTAMSVWGRNYLISDNNIHTMGQEGIVGTDVADVIIEDNIIHDIAEHGDCVQFWSVGGIYPPEGPNSEYVFNRNIIIRRNIMYDSGTGIIEPAGQILLWNGFIPEVPGGPGMENVLVENNLIYGARGSAWEINVRDTNDLKFRNNIVGSNLGGVDGKALFINCKITEFRNNIVRLLDVWGGTLENEEYNIVYLWWVHMGGHTKGEHTLTLTSENQFRALFKDIDSNDYYPATNSSAINFCPKEGAPDTDVLGNPRDASPDAGAYEYISSTPPSPPPSILYGDVSEDGSITAYDAALTAQYSVALITLTPNQIKAADVSGNGEVSAYDAALILQKIAGILVGF